MVEQHQIDRVNLNDPRAQEFIEAVAACLVHAVQQEAPGPEVKPLALELWSPHPVVVACNSQKGAGCERVG